jgi:hypothetical protein
VCPDLLAAEGKCIPSPRASRATHSPDDSPLHYTPQRVKPSVSVVRACQSYVQKGKTERIHLLAPALSKEILRLAASRPRYQNDLPLRQDERDGPRGLEEVAACVVGGWEAGWAAFDVHRDRADV